MDEKKLMKQTREKNIYTLKRRENIITGGWEGKIYKLEGGKKT